MRRVLVATFQVEVNTKPMFRFTIRDVLWLMLVMAMAIAWWVDHRRVKIEAERSKRVVSAYELKQIELGDLRRQRYELEQLRDEIQNPIQIIPFNDAPPIVIKAAQDRWPDFNFDEVLKSNNGLYEVRGKNKTGKIYKARVSASGAILALEWSD